MQKQINLKQCPTKREMNEKVFFLFGEVREQTGH